MELPQDDQYTDAVRIAAVAFAVPISLLSFAGNLLTILAVIRTPSLQIKPNIFIVGLSVSDMIYGTFLVPMIAVNYWNNGRVFGSGLCVVFAIFIFLFVYESIANLVGIAVCRYLKILRPQIFRSIFRGQKRSVMVAVGLWLLPLIALTPPIILQKFGYEQQTLSCTYLRGGLNILMFVVLFPIPLTFVAFCYLRILCKVFSNRRKVQRTRSKTSAQKPAPREDYRYTWTMVTIFVVFIVAYTPYLLYNLFSAIYPHNRNHTLCFVCTLPVWLSNCINPLVYAVSNRRFRDAFHAIVRGRRSIFVRIEVLKPPKRNVIGLKTLAGSNANMLIVDASTNKQNAQSYF